MFDGKFSISWELSLVCISKEPECSPQMKEHVLLPLFLPCWLSLLFLVVFWGPQEFPSYFMCLCYALPFLDITKVFQHHTVDPVEKQDMEHLKEGPTMFIISSFSFLILFWSCTKICPGNLFFYFSLLAFSFHVDFGEYLRRCLDFVIGSGVALGLSVFMAILHIPWHFGGQVLDACVADMVLSVYLWLSQSDSELLLLLGPAVLIQGTRWVKISLSTK